MEKVSLTEKQRHWLGHLEACRSAGFSMKAYAEKHGLKLQQLYYWKKYLRQLGVLEVEQKATFVKAVCQNEPLSEKPVSIKLSNGICIEVPCDFDVAVMVDLLCFARRL
ncbi:MAG: hypothetical protein AAF228_12950 [Pseudomonadota bacterium]